MGHHSCCNQQKVKRGLWSPEEDEKLIRYITTHGYGCWSEVPERAGLQRCGKSCRLRWINYLRPDIRRGRFSPDEEKLIINLHDVVGNSVFVTINNIYDTVKVLGGGHSHRFVARWAHIANHLPGRTDNEIKNYWNSWIKKKLRKPPTQTTNQTSENPILINPNTNNINPNNNQLQFIPQDLFSSKTSLLPENLLFSPCPLFMFDAPAASLDGTFPLEFFLESSLSSPTSQMENNVQQLCADNVPLPPPTALTNGIVDAANDLNNHVGMSNMAGQDQHDLFALACLPRQEQDNWVETQQCPSYNFWDDDIDEAVLGRDHNIVAPDTSSAGSTALPSFPSPL